jgi:hypothetical protein
MSGEHNIALYVDMKILSQSCTNIIHIGPNGGEKQLVFSLTPSVSGL